MFFILCNMENNINEEKISGYDLSRNWFDWCFENPELISPNHSAIYFFAVEHCNRLGWKKKFGFPTQMAMDAIGIKKHETYIRYFNDLVSWGFFVLIQKSKNQYSSNIISIGSAIIKNGEALGKAIRKHTGKQIETIGESNSSVNKPITIEPITIEPINIEFDIFWKSYPISRRTKKQKCEVFWKKLKDEEREFIVKNLNKYISSKEEQFLKLTYSFFKEEKYKDENFICTTKHIQKSKQQSELEFAKQNFRFNPKDMEV